MIQLILKFRVYILVLLILLEIFLTVGVYFEEKNSARIYFFLESFTSFLILAIALTFLDKLNLYLFLTSKHEYLNNVSPCSYIFYDTKKKKFVIPDNTYKMLSLDRKVNYNTHDFLSLFSKTDAKEIEQCIKRPSLIKQHEKLGSVSLINKYNEHKHFKYSMQYLEDGKYLIHGIIFWFIDFSDSIEHEKHIIALIKKYRLMSFELDFLFSNLPIPVWRRERDGAVVYSNGALKKITNRLNSNEETFEFESGLKRLSEIALLEKRTAKIAKSINYKGKNINYEFNEVPIGHDFGTVGFAIEKTEYEELDKANNLLSNTLDRILELSSNGIIIIDKNTNIFQFNQVLVNMFGLDQKWLAGKPNYSSFWDKLRELKRLPEMKNYKEFKDGQLELIRRLTEPKSEFMHLPNGQTLRFSIIPSGTNTIILFDNLTDVLNIERSYNELMSVYKSIVNKLNQSIIIFGQDGRIRLYNSMFINFTKIDEEFMKSFPHVSDVIANSNAPLDSLKSHIINCLESRKNASVEIIDGDGKSYESQVSSLPDNSVLVMINKK